MPAPNTQQGNVTTATRKASRGFRRWTFVFAFGLVALGCGASEDDDDLSSPKPSSTATRLSAAFAKNCATCHGPDGRGAGSFPTIPGKLSEDRYISTVRKGTPGGMPSFTTAQIKDADLKNDYAWLTTQRKD